MTKDEALSMALEALEEISTLYMSLPKKGCMALAAIEEVLAQPEGCQCPACKITTHASDCAVHNAPAHPIGKCDCGAQPERPAVQREPDRAAFERHWKKVRGHKKSDRELKRHPLQPQTYVQDSANRHWVTWQAATRCAATPQPAVPVEDDPCPGCRKGGVCRTPKCGRLKLPVDHPYRATTPQPAVPERKPLSMQERTSIVRANKSFHDKDEIDAYGIIDDVEAAHGIKREA